MTDADQQNLRRIERDRRRREALLLLLLLSFSGRALRQARSAVRVGTDPAQAAADAIRGTGPLALGHVHWQGLSARVLPVLAETWLAGAHRAGEMVGLKVGVATDSDIPVSVTQAAQDLESKTATAVSVAVETGLADAAEAGVNATKTLPLITQAFHDKGLAEENDVALEAGAERIIVTTYGAGMFEAWEAKATDRVTGYRHSSVLDNGTTVICRQRDGLRLPRTDPYWRANWPSLHWRCRSVILPLMGKFEASTVYPTTAPAPGFGQAPLIAFGALVGR